MRAEVFNLFDRVIWNVPDSILNFSSSNFGLITSQLNSARQVQFGAKLYW